MRFLKVAGLVMTAALASMAVLAASASANATICTNDIPHQDVNSCGGLHGKHVKDGTPIAAQLETNQSATLTVTNASGSSVRTVHCKVSTVAGKVIGTHGAGQIESLKFDQCESAGCSSVTAATPRAGKSFPWPATVTWTSGTNGQMHVTGPSGKFTGTCTFGITVTCEYEASTATVNVIGGTPATVEAKNVPLTRVAGPEFTCGTNAHWSGNYTVTTPSSLFILKTVA